MKEVVRDLLGAIGRVINFLFPFRLPQRIYRHMGFKGTFVFKIEKNKLRFNNVRDLISNDIFYSGIFGNYEGETLRLWYEISKEVNGLVLDIGAFSGIFSLVAASANKQSSIIAFEPHPNNFDLLCKNIQMNGFSNITLENRAISNKTGKVVFYNEGRGHIPGLSLIKHRHIHPESSTISCAAISFKEYLESNHKEQILSLIKLDIERAELIVLRDGIERLQKNQTIIFCEILDRESIFPIQSLFNKIDYVFINVNDEKKRLIYSGTSTEDLPEDLGENWVILPKQIMERKKIRDVFLKFNCN
jgi:FkbM family methyltransferase